ncbi:hypothetical protein [Rhodobacter sp. SY28-1]|uniref:hypothetical protein n=1 Tax=Rhodobacter sp. SY28-1 TaxID=2562317 RepID=UPI0010BFAA9A|nr:hypothetical protein [Rhodobacter sp. SY28-1]
MRASGIAEFCLKLDQSVAEAERLCAAHTLVDEPVALKILPLTADMRERSESVISKKKTPSAKAAPKASQKRIWGIDSLLEVVKNFPPNEQGLDIIRHLLNQKLTEKPVTVEHRDVLVRALTGSAIGAMSVEKFLKQVEHEVQDFADGPWCDLRPQANQRERG